MKPKLKWHPTSKKHRPKRPRQHFSGEVWHYESVSFFLNSPPLPQGVALLKEESK